MRDPFTCVQKDTDIVDKSSIEYKALEQEYTFDGAFFCTKFLIGLVLCPVAELRVLIYAYVYLGPSRTKKIGGRFARFVRVPC